MGQFLLKRVFHMFPILLGVSLLTFLLLDLTPGDYFTALENNPQITKERLDQLRAKWHLDEPWYVQYGYWLKNIWFADGKMGDLKAAWNREGDGKVGRVLKLALLPDFGDSLQYKQPSSQLIALRLWNTFLLSLMAMILAWGVALPLGIWAAVKKDTWVDRTCSGIAFLGLSIPEILLGLLALMFAYSTGWFPIGGVESDKYYGVEEWSIPRVIDRCHHLILPAAVLAASSLAGLMRQMRSNLLDTLRAEYVTTARAKGLSEGWVIYKHALRNAINPLLTIFGYSLAHLLSGAFIVENVMSWPGLGRLTLEALQQQDYPLVVAAVLMATALLVAGNFVADLLLAWSDPRIRLEK
ncbi:MAG: ABC transporter permease [Pedosphaera sp.]|nr:ABC transporter permease [Pedosphaera sp.]